MGRKIKDMSRTPPAATGRLVSGFTLIELLVVIAIIGALASIVLASLVSAREKARLARAQEELHQLATAVELYANDHNGSFPADANRNIPPGLEAYLPNGDWPNAPWPGSVYDWDSWAPGDFSYAPKVQTYQISIRFCDINGANCQYPKETWADDFDQYSAVYYCISGSCRAHDSQPLSHPAYCVNCGQ